MSSAVDRARLHGHPIQMDGSSSSDDSQQRRVRKRAREISSSEDLESDQRQKVPRRSSNSSPLVEDEAAGVGGAPIDVVDVDLLSTRRSPSPPRSFVSIVDLTEDAPSPPRAASVPSNLDAIHHDDPIVLSTRLPYLPYLPSLPSLFTVRHAYPLVQRSRSAGPTEVILLDMLRNHPPKPPPPPPMNVSGGYWARRRESMAAGAEKKDAPEEAYNNTDGSTGSYLGKDCVVCLSPITDVSAAICGHVFCEGCLLQSIRSQGKCPTCRRPLTENDIHPLFI